LLEKIILLVKKYKFILIVLVVLIISFILLLPNNKEEIIENNIEVEEIGTIDEMSKIKVDIKGAVNNPGVYELDSNTRVVDAINISGGLTKDADTSVINLSKNLFDEMVIIIYTQKEIKEAKSGSMVIKYVEKECICPEIENNACIENEVNNDTNGKISLNKASLSELMTLSGIGEAKAKLIIEYREKTPFKDIGEIMNIKGIGNSIYEKIKDDITI